MGKRTRKKGSYSVMQSDRNSFCSDVVLDSVNMASIDEVYKIYEKHEKNSYCLLGLFFNGYFK